jgi:formate dehydrogenase alpha subunit
VNTQHPTVTLTIDNRPVSAAKGATILDAARAHDIYIPTLCFLEGLSPHGGCRMCIVEVEGVRTFPTACTTPVEEGMVVRTHTAQIQSMRMDILQLFLTEHTSSCLICDEKVECKQFMPTIRKAGVTTGCRYCPKDTQCELQAVAESMEVDRIDYPIYYRNLRVETEDPFYDRDYNLCILCGRCVRMCQEVRTANVLAYKYRGRQAIIGPAFSRTHLEGGCEFCGACVAVCPTGTLREKARAWEGKPEREETTTCSFCGVGCQLRLLVKGDRVIGSLPADDPLVNQGQLCVKGRFCNTELVNGYRRLKNPYSRFGAIPTEISWEQAVDQAAERLAACGPGDFALLASTNCTTEDLYVAQKFARVAMKTHQVDTAARVFYGRGFDPYLRLMGRSVPLSSLREAEVVLAVGLDSRFGRSVVGVALRRAEKNGTRIITINPRQHSYSLLARLWLRPKPGTEAELLRDLRGRLDVPAADPVGAAADCPGADLDEAARLLRESGRTVILVGSEFMQYDQAAEILEAIGDLAEAAGAGVMPLPAQNNLAGSLLAGAYPEMLPGGVPLDNAAQRKIAENVWGVPLPASDSGWNAWKLWAGQPVKVLYLMGELPPRPETPADYLIFQNIYPPEPYCRADLVLPAAAATESDGTFVNGEGRVQVVRKAVAPPGNALPDWRILCLIARRMGVGGFDFDDVDAIREEMGRFAAAYHNFGESRREPAPFRWTGRIDTEAAAEPTGGDSPGGPFLLTVSEVEHSHRGFPLSVWVEGSRMLLTEGMLEINPEDAAAAGIAAGDPVTVIAGGTELTWPAKLLREQPPGTLHASLRECAEIRPNPQTVTIRKAHV